MANDFASNVTSFCLAFAVMSSNSIGDYISNQTDDVMMFSSNQFDSAYNETIVDLYGNSSITNNSAMKSLPIEISDEAQEFLDNNPAYNNAIATIRYMLGIYFRGCRIIADAIYDFDEGHSFLKLYVADEDSVDNLMHKLEAFDDEWWLLSNEYKLGNIFVDVMAL